MLRAWPILGRDRELALVERLDDPEFRGVLLVGLAGVGKTELARELLRVAVELGLPTARVTGFPTGSDLPFASTAHLLPDDLGRLDGPGGDTGLAGLFLLAEGAIRRLAADRRLVVMVDDVDHVDPHSQALLAASANAGTTVIVATLRTGRTAPAIDQLVRRGHLELVTVEPLPEHVTESIVRQVLGGRVDDDVVDRLRSVATGNPLVLREILESAVANDTLRRVGDSWRLVGRIAMTARLHDVAAERLAPCTPAERELMEFLAVAGELPSTVAETLVGEAAIDGLLRRDLATERQDGRRLILRAIHPAYDEVIRDSMTIRRARARRRRLADAFDARGSRRRDDRLRVALWRLDSGGTVDPAALLHAARLALADGRLEEAERLVDAADTARPTIEGTRIRAELAFIRGEAELVERLCLGLLEQDLSETERVAVTRRRVQNLFFGLGSPEALTANEAARSLVHDPVLRAAIDAHQATIEVVAARPARALELAEPLLDAPEPRTRVEAALAASLVHAVSGRAERALAAIDRAVTDLSEIGPVLGMLGPGSLVFNRVIALSSAGRSDEAIAAGTAAIRDGAVDAAPSTGPLVELAVVRTLVHLGRLREATRRASRERERSAAAGLVAQQRWAAALELTARCALGDLDGLDELDDEIRRLERAVPGRGLFHFDIDRAHAWWSAADGRLTEARDAAQQQFAWCSRIGLDLGAAAAVIDIARFGDPETARRLVGVIRLGDDRPLLALARRAVSTAADGEPGGLEEMAVSFGETGAALLAAEWWTLAARAHRASGDPRAASRCATVAATLTDPGDDGDRPLPFATPILRAAVADGPEQLTAREREVALLAAAGRTNREIAELLVVSVRTIDHHLQRVYDKLGIRSRRDLRNAFRSETGPGPEPRPDR